jgi:hypothetical protein
LIHIRRTNKSGKITFSTERDEIGRYLDKKEAGCNMCHTSGETKVQAFTMNRSRVFLDKQSKQVAGMAKAIYNEDGCYLSAGHATHPSKGHWASQQRVQTSDQGHGDRDWEDCLLSNPGLCIFDNGIALEDKPFRKSSQEPAFLQRIRLWLFFTKNLYKKT